jgi:DNA recombination protein RmuC
MDDKQLTLLLIILVCVCIAIFITWLISRRVMHKNIIEAVRNREMLYNLELNQLRENTHKLGLSHQESRLEAQNYLVEINNLKENIQNTQHQLIGLQEKNQYIPILQTEKKGLEDKYMQLLQEKQKMAANIAHLSTKLEHEQLQNLEKINLLQDNKESLIQTFKILAQDIFEEKSQRFTEQNQTNLNQLLEPLRSQITDFKGKVEEVYTIEGKERSALVEQVKIMMNLNQQLSKDANNLAKALKGDNKIQGNWGELVLEKVLESGGLRKNFEYQMQEAHVNEEGKRIQPDVIVHLPEKRYIIIDAKASISAYADYMHAEIDEVRDIALKKHIESVRLHIKTLAEKNYQHIYGERSPDFVLMFVPIEPAFMLAIANDNSLWHDAWKKNILLVSPSTLLFVIRMVAQIWRSEYQSQNTKDIVKRGAELYDKLVGFVDDMQKIGEHMNKAKHTYDKAYSKFKGGKGNVIRQAELLKNLGIKPSKQLPDDLIDASMAIDNDETVNYENIENIEHIENADHSDNDLDNSVEIKKEDK